MNYIDPHIHMVSRTTDDYKRMALAGCVLVSEPAFWAGFDRSGPEGFRDYFRQLVQFERNRASLYKIEHQTWLCINAKEAENVELSREVIQMIPEFLDLPGVLGIGEIGLNKNTRNEATVFLEHVELAARRQELILVHTPHLADKYQGTRMILDMLRGDRRVAPERVCIDHVEEHTIRPALEAGHWVGMTLYPTTKCTPARAVDMVELYGTERILVNSAGDWGHSDPLAVPEFIFEMRSRGHDEATIRKVVFENPLAFFGQCSRFSFTAERGGRGDFSGLTRPNSLWCWDWLRSGEFDRPIESPIPRFPPAKALHEASSLVPPADPPRPRRPARRSESTQGRQAGRSQTDARADRDP